METSASTRAVIDETGEAIRTKMSVTAPLSMIGAVPFVRATPTPP
jgi:hypothetical protein